MAKWSGNKVSPEQINNGNEYSVNDNVSIEELNGIFNNSINAQEKSEEALEKANSAYEANGTLVKINGENQTEWDATFAEKLKNESENEIYAKTNGSYFGVTCKSDVEGTITLNGTSTANLIIPLDFIFDDIDYDANYCLRDFGNAQYEIALIESTTELDAVLRTSWTPRKIGSDRKKGSAIYLYNSKDVTFDNYKIKLTLVKRNEVPTEHHVYNPNRHITNPQAEFLKEKFNDSVNEFKVPFGVFKYNTADSHLVINGNSVAIKDAGGNSSYVIIDTKFTFEEFSLSAKFSNNYERYIYAPFDENNNLITDLVVEGMQYLKAYNGYFKDADSISVKKDSRVAYFRIGFVATSGGGVTTFSDIMLNKGLTPVPPQDYNQKEHITNEQADLLKSEWEKSKNLFNKNDIKVGVVIDRDTGGLLLQDGYCASNYIEVEPNTTYHFEGFNVWYTACYDENMNYIGHMENEKNMTTLANTKYIRATLLLSSLDIAQIEKGSVATPYQEYNGEIIHRGDIKPVLLWENGNPNSDMVATSLILSKQIEIGKKYGIVWSFGKGWNKLITEFIYNSSVDGIELSFCRNIASDNHLNISTRQLAFQDNVVYVSDCFYYDGTFSGTILNSLNIPLQIYELPN